VIGVRGHNNQTSQVNLIFFSVELNRLNGNAANFTTFFDKVLTGISSLTFQF